MRTQSNQKDGALTTPTTPNVRKRQVDQKSSTFFDAPSMRNIREGVKRAKERQAESVNKQCAKKADKGGRKKVLEVNDICTLTLDSRIKAIFKYSPVMVTKVTEGRNKEKRYSICSLHGH